MDYKTIKDKKTGYRIEGYNGETLVYVQTLNAFTGAPFVSEEECEQYKKDMGLVPIEQPIETEEPIVEQPQENI